MSEGVDNRSSLLLLIQSTFAGSVIMPEDSRLAHNGQSTLQ